MLNSGDEHSSRLQAIKARFPLGVQYCRPPSPPTNEWATDLEHARYLGFDHIYAWVMWPWVERRPGEWSWQDYDQLLDLASRVGLGVILNLELWAIPAWAERDEFRTVDLDGRPRPFRASIIHSLFSARPCWDNPELREFGTRFLSKTVERYRGHPGLLLWKVWNEPDQLACTCPATITKYRAWLRERFGSLEAISSFLGRWYAHWEDLRHPTHPGDTPAHLLYREFLCQSIAETTRWAHAIVRRTDPDHPILTDTKSRSTPRLDTFEEQVWDDWEMAGIPDIFGGHLHSTIFHPAHDSTLEYAKPVLDLEAKRSATSRLITRQSYWVTELPGGSGRMNKYHRDLLPGEMTFNLWTAIAHGAKSLGVWQFKPERIGPEAPGWGLVNYDGSDTFQSREFALFADEVHRHEDLFVRAQALPTEFGLFYSPESNGAVGCAGHFSYATAFLGAFSSLWLRNIAFDIVRRPETLRVYKVVYFPMPWWISSSAAEQILDFVRSGGTAVVEAGFASHAENGWYAPDAPTHGLAAALGYREGAPRSIQRITADTPYGTLVGATESRAVEIAGANVLARFTDGSPAVLRCSVGRGTLIYIATYPSLHFATTGDLESARTLGGLAGFEPALLAQPEGQVTCRLLARDSDRVLVVFNHLRENVAANLELPFEVGSYEAIHCQAASVEVSGRRISVKLRGKEVVVLLLTDLGAD